MAAAGADAFVDGDGLLCARPEEGFAHQLAGGITPAQAHALRADHPIAVDADAGFVEALHIDQQDCRQMPWHRFGAEAGPPRHGAALPQAVPIAEDLRSEEHTSELQSLMRISYAV